jgi:hypothetical protein
MKAKAVPTFTKEADLCAAFLAEVAKDQNWQAYPETAGFDILLVRKADGLQIGIEAKLSFNLKVVTQVLPSYSSWNAATAGPDHRAVLVPRNEVQNGLHTICAWLGITIISLSAPGTGYRWNSGFNPHLPRLRWDSEDWHYWAPLKRCPLPDYVPDVGAGESAPVQLTEWKIKAIKLAVILEERPVSRHDFKVLGISASRWLEPTWGWLKRVDGTKTFVAGPRMPDFKAQHPINYAQIAADKAKWMPPALPKEQLMCQGELAL